MHDMFNCNRGHFVRWKNTANINRLVLIFPTLLIVFFLILSSHAAAKDGGVRPVVHVGGGWICHHTNLLIRKVNPMVTMLNW